jgi:hypothetical protein
MPQGIIGGAQDGMTLGLIRRIRGMEGSRDARTRGWTVLFGFAYFALAEAGCRLVDPPVIRMMRNRTRAGETFDNLGVSLRAQYSSLRQVQVSACACREADRIVHVRCSPGDVSVLKSMG